MSQISIKGDIKSISDKQLNVICKALEELNFIGHEVNIEPLGKVGDNYASEVKIITIKTNGTETFNIIVKINPNLGIDNAMKFVSSILFNNEIIIYTEVLPMMVEFQKASGTPVDDLIRYPSCYGNSRERGHEVILLEDLSKENYTMLDKFDPLSHDTIKHILSDLARFHSMSYAIRKKDPEMFAELLKKFTDLNAVKELQSQQKGLVVLGENFSKIFDKEIYKNIVIAMLRDHSKNITKLIESDTGSKYTVILHGDSWTNNILFKLEDGIPEKCVLIDYQLARESLPVADILYLVFNCTDYETRENHFYDWIDFYHSQLENHLFNFGLKVSNVYPRDKLDSDLKRYGKAYLGYGMLVLSILLRQSEDSAVVKEAMATSDGLTDFLKIGHLKKESILMIKERFEGLIDSCIELGYINADCK